MVYGFYHCSYTQWSFKQIFNKYEDKFIYIPKIACYHNYIKKVRLALCFFGLTRSLKFTLPSIEKFIFAPLKNHGIKHDIFLHTYKLKKSYVNPRAGENNILLDINEYKLLNPDFHMIENKDDISRDLDLVKYRTMGNPWKDEPGAIKGDFTTLDNHVLFLWSQKQLTNMWQETKRNYTHIVFCRPDVLYTIPLQVSWFSFTTNKICIPNFCLYPNVNDRFAIGHPKEMIIYGNRFNEALEYSKKHPLLSEEFLDATLKRHNIQYKYIKFYFIRIRANMKKNGDDIQHVKNLTRRNKLSQKVTNKFTRKRINGSIYIP